MIEGVLLAGMSAAIAGKVDTIPVSPTLASDLSWYELTYRRRVKKTEDRRPMACGQYPNSFTIVSGEFIRDSSSPDLPPHGTSQIRLTIRSSLPPPPPPPLSSTLDSGLSHFEIYPHRSCALARNLLNRTR